MQQGRYSKINPAPVDQNGMHPDPSQCINFVAFVAIPIVLFMNPVGVGFALGRQTIALGPASLRLKNTQGPCWAHDSGH